MSDEQQMTDEELGAPIPDEVKEPKPEEPEKKADAEPEKKETPSNEPEKPAEQPPRDQAVPRARFDALHANFKAAQEEAARLEAELQALKKQPEAQAVDVDALEKSYFDAAFVDFDNEKALAIRRQINAELQRQSEQIAERRIMERESAKSLETSLTLMQSTAARLIAENPALDGGMENPLVVEVVEYRDYLIAKGMVPHIALEKAVALIAPPATKKEEKQDQSAIDPRKAAAVKRGAETENAQPAGSVAGVGNRTTPVESAVLTPKQWRALPQEEQERRLAE